MGRIDEIKEWMDRPLFVGTYDQVAEELRSARSNLRCLLSELEAAQKAHALVCDSLAKIQDEIVAPLQAENVRLAEEARDYRRALDFALDEWAAETTDCAICGKPKLESFYRAEAKAGGEG